MASFISRDVVNLPDSMELNNQKYLVNVSMLVGLPVLGIFMVYDLIIGRYLIGSVLVLMFVLLLCLFLAINKKSYKAKESQIGRFWHRPYYEYRTRCLYTNLSPNRHSSLHVARAGTRKQPEYCIRYLCRWNCIVRNAYRCPTVYTGGYSIPSSL